MGVIKQTTMQEYNGTDYDTILPKSVYTTTGTLTSSGWGSNNRQAINIPQVMADSAVIVSADPTYATAYTNAGILCVSQADGTLTFSKYSGTSPSDITVNIFIL